MTIEDRNLAAGTVLTATYKGHVHTCEVIETDDGVRFRLMANGQLFASPSAAGSAVMAGIACNGWRFWRRAVQASEEAAEAIEARRRRIPGSSRQIRRLPNQRGVPEGKVKWFCSACMASFVSDDTGAPEVCPKGHPIEAVAQFA